VKEIIHHADVAVYAAKDGGRNQIQIYSPELVTLVN
jgi:PleD family two-component response regulator